MPVTSGLVGSPKIGADVVDGLVADPKAPFGEIVIGLVKAGSELLTRVVAGCTAFQTVGGDPSRWRR